MIRARCHSGSMQQLIELSKPFLKRYLIEIVLITISIVVAIISFSMYFGADNNINTDEELEIKAPIMANKNIETIFVDISGSVIKPDVYEVKAGTRLKNILQKAGGLSDMADKGFFDRNYNLAQIVSDQEKIYVPSYLEVQMGLFIEPSQTITTVRTQAQSVNSDNQITAKQIDVNIATAEELDTLPGIGVSTANKIIQNRPYQSISELIDKKIVKKNVYDAIQPLIATN